MDDANNDAVAPTSCMLVDLPVGVIGIVLSFQAHKDRLSLATTCNDLLKKVEAFSQRTWREIGERGDDTWEARIRDASEVIETEVPHSLLELPQRFLLARAYHTPLYSITDPRRDDVWNGGVLPGGETVAVAALDERNSVCNVWDLNTKQCVRTFSISQEDDRLPHIDRVWFCGEYLVVDADDRLRVYSITGELLQRPGFVVDKNILSVVGDEKHVFFTMDKDSSMYCLDLASGLVRKNEVFSAGQESPSQFFQVEVSEGMVIALRSLPDDDYRVDNTLGLYILDYNGREYSVQHFFPGRYDFFRAARDDPSLFVATFSDRVDVLKLVDGRFSCSTSFRTDVIYRRTQSGGMYVRVRLVSDSKLYIQGAGGEVVVHSTVNGERLHSIRSPPEHTSVISIGSNGSELIYIYLRRRTQGVEYPTIQACCLPGY